MSGREQFNLDIFVHLAHDSRLNPHTLHIEDTIASTPSLRPLNPATSHNNNNNNGGLRACVHAAEDIEPIRVTRVKYYAPLPLRWAKQDYGQPHTPHHFRSTAKGFLLLLSVCIQCASFMHMLRLFFSVFCEFQVPPMGLEYELKRVESFTMDPFGCSYSWNDAKEDVGERKIVGA